MGGDNQRMNAARVVLFALAALLLTGECAPDVQTLDPGASSANKANPAEQETKTKAEKTAKDVAPMHEKLPLNAHDHTEEMKKAAAGVTGNGASTVQKKMELQTKKMKDARVKKENDQAAAAQAAADAAAESGKAVATGVDALADLSGIQVTGQSQPFCARITTSGECMGKCQWKANACVCGDLTSVNDCGQEESELVRSPHTQALAFH